MVMLPRSPRPRTLAVLAAVLGAVAAFVGPGPLPYASGGTDGGGLRVRVLVLTMFPAETRPWLEREPLARTVDVPGATAPLRCSGRGLCVTTTGMGKANAAAAVAAVLNSPRLDLDRAYFLTAGIGGTPPDNGTLGFASWARWLVDYDLGHHVSSATDPTVPHGYLKGGATGTNAFRLDDRLVGTAYRLTEDTGLADSRAAAGNRGHYPGQSGRTPYVAVCDSVTGDNYWTGADQSARARYITELWTKGEGDYCMTQMEDTAIAAVLARHGHLDRYLALRTASDFDRPYAGQSAKEVLTEFPGLGIAVENAYRVASKVAHHLSRR
ncbi:hypothetical protein [Streptomyces cucumeris]|uniref:hypothetical protein n=1 Tax=Streptomyces cucumeris TaxID=2962890 RepID=UPI003D72A144